MDIPTSRELKIHAARQLEHSPQQKYIVLVYSAFVLALTASVTVANYLLQMQISQSGGGLGNMGLRSVLSTFQTMLPLVQTLVVMCLEVGYLNAMLRIARGQYASKNSLRLGFDRFWVLLRCTLLKSLRFFLVGFACLYLAVMIFLMTPLSRSAMEILIPLMSQTSVISEQIVLDDAAYMQLSAAMTPALLIFFALYLLMAAPIFYRYRLSSYLIIDHPAMGASMALRESRRLMRGNCLKLLRLDVSFWWYYIALSAASVVCYGDMLLPMVGITFPWSDTFSYFLFYGLYLVIQFAIYYYLRNRLEVTCALFYEAVKPEEKQDSGVVLGNIFQM